MAKRLQVILKDPEYREVQRAASSPPVTLPKNLPPSAPPFS